MEVRHKNSLRLHSDLHNQLKWDQDEEKLAMDETETPFSQIASPAVNAHQEAMASP